MESIPSFLAAFLIGLTGGVHCFGMCGGIVGVLTFGAPASARWLRLLAYNGGRILSYMSAGALAGSVGAWAAHLGSVRYAQLGLQLVAGLLMILLGLHLAGRSPMLSRLERAGGVVWRRIEPLGRRWLPVRTPAQALGIGLVWGWLPCGLVYSVLVWALSAGGAWNGALLLLCFGLGTLPMLLAMGALATTLAPFVRGPTLRLWAGALVIAFGIYQIGIAVRSV